MNDNTYTVDRLKAAVAAAKKRGQFDGMFPDDDPDIVKMRELPYLNEALCVIRYRYPLARGLTAFKLRFGDHWELVPAREVELVVAQLIALAQTVPEKVQDFTGFSLEMLLQSRDDLKRIVSGRVEIVTTRPDRNPRGTVSTLRNRGGEKGSKHGIGKQGTAPHCTGGQTLSRPDPQIRGRNWTPQGCGPALTLSSLSDREKDCLRQNESTRPACRGRIFCGGAIKHEPIDQTHHPQSTPRA